MPNYLAWRNALLLLLLSGVSAFGQTIPDVYIDIRDSRIWLIPNKTDLLPDGVLPGLAGIEVKSAGGYLGRDDYEVMPGVIAPGASNAPFAFGDASFLVENPNEHTYGVLGALRTVDVVGPTLTAITYSASLEMARSDLTVQVGANISLPARGLRVELIPEPDFTSLSFGVVSAIATLQLRRRRFALL